MHIHLTTHSTYSLQEGLATPAELVQAAQAHGMSALGLTDHHLLTGSVEFVTACKNAGIQPILGLEIDFEGSPLHLLATSNLCRLSSAIALSETPCSLDLLASHSKDLIALSKTPKPLDAYHTATSLLGLNAPLLVRASWKWTTNGQRARRAVSASEESGTS